jgi:hypothetical protein
MAVFKSLSTFGSVPLAMQLSAALTFWHRSFTFNSNKSPTWRNNFLVYYPDVCLQLNMFRAFSRPSSGAQWLPAGRPARPRTQHDYHHDTKAKPEAATALTELLMMGGKRPKINVRIINWKIVASGWWFIWIVRWCTDLQTLNFTFPF